MWRKFSDEQPDGLLTNATLCQVSQLQVYVERTGLATTGTQTTCILPPLLTVPNYKWYCGHTTPSVSPPPQSCSALITTCAHIATCDVPMQDKIFMIFLLPSYKSLMECPPSGQTVVSSPILEALFKTSLRRGRSVRVYIVITNKSCFLPTT